MSIFLKTKSLLNQLFDRPQRLIYCFSIVFLSTSVTALWNEYDAYTNPLQQFDVLVYGGTPAGIAAALSAAELERNVLLVEPSGHVGGMATEGGIGLRDGPEYMRSNPKSSQFRWGLRNARFYNSSSTIPIWQPDHWVGEQSFMKMLKDANVRIIFNSSLVEGIDSIQIENNNSKRSITKVALQIAEEGIRWFSAKYFIDASYEGELVMASGISYTYGRESSDMYNESRGGVTASSQSQFQVNVSATSNGQLLKYIVEGPDPRTRIGQSDSNLMAYSYRVCLTQNKSNLAPITPPGLYNPFDFELARRLVRAELQANLTLSEPWLNLVYSGYNQIKNKGMKYDACCGLSPVGIDAAGLATGYATASRSQRKQISAAHRYYVQGLMWFWLTDPSIPESIRREHAKFGLCKDEWVDNGHFPRQLYVREAIRLVGDRVFIQSDRRKGCKKDSIAIGSWGLDNHEMQRVAILNKNKSDTELIAYNEGLTGYDQGGIFPFEIPFWVILPKRAEMINLAVPNCPSVSHVAFGAIREEPTLWQLGQAAGTAAAIASTEDDLFPLHSVEIKGLQAALVKQGNIVHWPPFAVCPDINSSNTIHSFEMDS